MSVNTSPIFTKVPNNGRARLTTANTTRDLSSLTNASVLIVAPTDHTRVDTVTFTHVAASQTQAAVAAVGRIFLCDDSAGTNPKLIAEVDLPVTPAPSATSKGPNQVVIFSPARNLKNGEALWVSISATQTSGGYDVVANAGDYTN